MNIKIVHYDSGVEGNYLPHETFFARAKRVTLLHSYCFNVYDNILRIKSRILRSH